MKKVEDSKTGTPEIVKMPESVVARVKGLDEQLEMLKEQYTNQARMVHQMKSDIINTSAETLNLEGEITLTPDYELSVIKKAE